MTISTISLPNVNNVDEKSSLTELVINIRMIVFAVTPLLLQVYRNIVIQQQPQGIFWSSETIIPTVELSSSAGVSAVSSLNIKKPPVPNSLMNCSLNVSDLKYVV